MPELRPDFQSGEEHENPGIEAVRHALWSQEHFSAERIGCRIDRKRPRKGFNQLMWTRVAGFLTSLDGFNQEAFDEVFEALSELDSKRSEPTNFNAN